MENIGEGKQLESLTSQVFEQLFKEWYAPICRSVHRIVQDQDVAEDIVQEVFYNFWNKRESYQINISFKSYLFKAGINAALTHIKKSKRWAPLENDNGIIVEPAVEVITEGYEGKELEGIISNTIDQLPPACRSMFVMSRYEEMSYKEIAEATNTSIKTVENQIGKALKVLRHALSSYMTVMLCWIVENLFHFFL